MLSFCNICVKPPSNNMGVIITCFGHLLPANSKAHNRLTPAQMCFAFCIAFLLFVRAGFAPFGLIIREPARPSETGHNTPDRSQSTR